MTGRFLIVNADDLGLSEGVDRGIAQAHERGIVTSASLMVRQPHAASAGEYARAHPDLSIGLHIDLAQWNAEAHEWDYQRVSFDDFHAVENEIAQQVELFRQMLNRDPTHIDSHQHLHRDGHAHTVARRIAPELNVPLRSFSAVQYRGDFFGQTGKGQPYPQGITLDALLALLCSLPPGVTEIGCHPGLDVDRALGYADERAVEVRVLCDSRLRECVAAERITLISHSLPSTARR